ncbi:MAG: flagellar hook-length control protein FliK [Sulfuricurvum sp.]|nr:flagellar hook-length control protein FliK [Sulfuricurvum sp.]
MVVQSKENKTSSSLIDLLGGAAKNKNSKTNDAFAQLLSSLNPPLKGEKNFGMVVDPKASKVIESTKTSESLQAGVKKLEDLLIHEEAKILPKELINVLSNDQVRSLIQKAKEFLKTTISEKAPEYKADPKSLPKTLMGLVELADKMGIDLSEITLSTLDDNEKPRYKELSSPLLSKSIIEVKEVSKGEVSLNPKVYEAITQLLNETKGVQGEIKTAKEGEKIAHQPLQSLLKELKQSTEAPTATSTATSTVTSMAASNSTVTSPSTLSTVLTPLEVSKEHPKTSAVASLDMLGTLLRGSSEIEKVESKESGKSLEEPSKLVGVLKADSLEVKGKEAVQSLRHFAIDLKEAAENYKPPFTRIMMKLNPEKLGEIEVTLVQRGNNVHVNIQSSNASSVAFLAHNATELKAQLASQGIPNATMNFMSGGESQSQNPNQQQQQQNRFQSYQSLLELESSEEQLSALEIILPHYA